MRDAARNKMKILLWAQYGAGDHYWGPGMSAYRLYKRNNGDRFSLSLAHGYRDQKRYAVFDEQFFISDLTGRDLKSVVKFLAASQRWIRDHAHQFDVVHVLDGNHMAFLPAVWFEKHGVPAYIKLASTNSGFSGNSFVSRLLGLRRYRHNKANDITGYISISNAITEEMKEAGIRSDKIHFIPNGVDIDRFKPVSQSTKAVLRKQLGLSNRFTVIFTGGFSSRKNPFVLARAFLPFLEDTGIQLLLIGPDRDGGAERRKIQALISQNHITNIHLIPFVKNIEEYYQASDLFALPSDREGLSNSLLEAQACGLPSLVTEISGSEDVVEPGRNGEFIKREPQEICEKIKRYYREPGRLKSQSARASILIRENYSADLILQQHLSLFSRNRQPSGAYA